jgi:hypothetical protein
LEDFLMAYDVPRSATDLDALSSGEATLPRRMVGSSTISISNGSMRLTYFTARKSETIASIRTATGAVAAAGATLARVGIYSVASNGNLTLVASIANDTTLWIATNTQYTRSLSASFAKQRGQRYAVGVLIVGSSTAPQFCGQGVLPPTEAVVAPRLAGLSISHTDLPATVAAASVSDGGLSIYTALVP